MRILAWILYALAGLSFYAGAGCALESKGGQAVCAGILTLLCIATARLLLGVWA